MGADHEPVYPAACAWQNGKELGFSGWGWVWLKKCLTKYTGNHNVHPFFGENVLWIVVIMILSTEAMIDVRYIELAVDGRVVGGKSLPKLTDMWGWWVTIAFEILSIHRYFTATPALKRWDFSKDCVHLILNECVRSLMEAPSKNTCRNTLQPTVLVSLIFCAHHPQQVSCWTSKGIPQNMPINQLKDV